MISDRDEGQARERVSAILLSLAATMQAYGHAYMPACPRQAIRLSRCFSNSTGPIHSSRGRSPTDAFAHATADVWNHLDVGLSSFRPYP
jgi:hypothetical protein